MELILENFIVNYSFKSCICKQKDMQVLISGEILLVQVYFNFKLFYLIYLKYCKTGSL